VGPLFIHFFLGLMCFFILLFVQHLFLVWIWCEVFRIMNIIFVLRSAYVLTLLALTNQRRIL
jgi:hypothetical protein